MTTATTIQDKSARMMALRSGEIWCSSNGNIHCVSDKCIGSRLFSEIGANPRQAQTFDGAYRLTDAERAELRDFMINEMGDSKPTCECKRLAL